MNRVSVKIGNITTLALVDTGASCSIISKQLWNKTQEAHKTTRLDRTGTLHITLKSVDQRHIKIKGKLCVSIIVDKYLIQCDFLVVDNCPYGMMMGQNFLENCNSDILDYKTENLVWKFKDTVRPEVMIQEKERKVMISKYLS